VRAWIDEVAGATRALNLPAARPRGDVAMTVAREDFLIEAALLARLRAFSAAHGVSVFMTLLCGFEIVLARASGQEDFCVGTLMANRSRPEVQPLVGLFANTVLLTCHVPAGATFGEVLGYTREAVLAGFRMEHVPFELLVQTLERERGVDRTATCQVLFVMQTPADALALPGLRVTSLQVPSTGKPGFYPTAFEIVANVIERAEDAVVSITYKTELFSREQIAEVADSWGRILRDVTCDASAG
jgi:non-ribosomal peptide synthetase component F